MVGKEATADSRLNAIWQGKPKRSVAAALIYLGVIAVNWLGAGSCCAQQVSPDPIEFSGDAVYRWQIGRADATLLEGDCVIQQSGQRVTADSVLLVVDGPVGQVRNRLVIKGMRVGNGPRAAEPRAITITTLDDPKILSPRYRGQPKEPPELLAYLPDSGDHVSNHLGAVRPVQFQDSVDVPPSELNAPPPVTLSDGATTGGFRILVGGGTKSLEVSGRGASMPADFSTFDRPETGETVLVARGGVTVLVRDVSVQMPGGELFELGTVSLSADRIVGWLPPDTIRNALQGTADLSQAQGELYLEGDIVVRAGERIIYAESMYYNITREQGIVLDAEAITTIDEFQGIVRLKADVLQQIAKGNFVAFDAAVTSSRMGVPRYWLQSQQLQLNDRVELDPQTGLPKRDTFVSSNNNFVYIGGFPVLYWPRFSTSLKEPSFYVSNARIRNDSVFGTQAMLDLNLIQLFGIDSAPPGLDWILSLDYLSERGPAVGTTLDYTLDSLFGIQGPVNGFFDAWVIDDRGLDTLGRDRIDLLPEQSTRGRALLRHRHYLPNDYEFIAELGWISDRNFLEQYLENEWDHDVDHRTALRLRKYCGSHLLDLTASVQVNDFFTVDEQLPRFEHFLLGGSLLRDRLTWSAHNKVGYERLNVGVPPENPAEAALNSPVPGEINGQGVVAATRQGLALPLNVGPVKIVPQISGEAAHYGEAADGDSLTRLFGQAGVRTSLQMWKFDSAVQSSLLNVRGLAHKVEWSAEYFYADSDTNLDELQLYNPLDDNAQEQFRRRFITEQFGGILPPQFDPRTYAFRQGFQQLIASPSDVIADDLQQFRLGLNQRWQTHRGLPGRERIVDLFQLDANLLLFPDADRDNFGETLGPATYEAKFNIGDRVTLLSDGYFDFFDDGLRSVSAGFRTSRPGLGDAYIGLLSLEGPISSTVLRSTLDYRMNEKWILSSGTVYDFGQVGNVGQTFGLTRIGESFLLRVGVNIDRGRDNSSVGFLIEPRLWPSRRTGRLGGQQIPPPGVEGLE